MSDKVVVVGGSGFLGSHVSDALSQAGFEVTIIDILPSPWLNSNQKMVIGSIFDDNQLKEVFSGTKFVFHLAGVADLAQATLNPRNTVVQNIIGSTNVLAACVEVGVERIFFASTVYVYSDKGAFYRVSKQAVELLIEAYYERFGLDYTILRYGSLYGPRAQNWNGLKRFVCQAVDEGKIVYPGTGEERREYIHVSDAARLTAEAVGQQFSRKCLTISGAQTMATSQVLNMIKEIMADTPEIVFETTSSDYNQFHYSLSPYKYTPKMGVKIVPREFVDIGQGILELIEEVYHDESEKEKMSV